MSQEEIKDLSYESLMKLLGKTDSIEEEHIEDDVEEDCEENLPPYIEPDKNFIKEVQSLRAHEKINNESKRIKEILLLKESQIGIVQPYLKNLGVEGFVYYEDTRTYKTISSLKQNLLDEPYWVISTMGKKGRIEPQKIKYDENVLSNYLNHVIISYNWKLIDQVDKETWTINLDFGGIIYPYKVKFLSSVGDNVLADYVMHKLSPVMNPYQCERICTYLLQDKKRLMENLNRFLTMLGYSFEDVIKTIEEESNSTYIINSIIRDLATKKSKKSEWKDNLAILIRTYHPNYLLKAVRNNLEDLSKLKMGVSIKSMSKNFLEKIADDVDMVDLVVLRHIFEDNKLYNILINLDKYMSTPTTTIIKNGGLQ